MPAEENKARDCHRFGTALLCLAILIVSGSSRLYRLGAWPFRADELATLAETAALFDASHGSDDSQIGRLPRITPISHSIHEFGYRCFGRTELGSRAIIAIIGTFTPLLLFAGLASPLGRSRAFITGLLAALWPEHIYYSQENRFYVTAFLAASLCMIAGARAIASRSIIWTILACLFGLAGVFTHTILILLLPGLFAAMFLATDAWKRPFPIAMLGVVVASLICLGIIYFGYTRPMLVQWNSGITWDYSGFRAIGNSVFHLGWPVALLGGFGAVLALVERGNQDRYWLVWAGLWAGSSLVLPQFLPFRPAYSFPIALGILVLAAQGIHAVYRLLGDRSRIAGVAWVATACVLNFPALVSHYTDGSSSDYRAAANQIRPRFQKGDAVVAVSPDLMKHYLPEARDPRAIDLYVPESAIERIGKEMESSARVWVVLNYGRGTRPDAVLNWLRSNGQQTFTKCQVRYDAFEYTTDVFLLKNPGIIPPDSLP
jgi:predicted membrane-bound mannosyltransferase